MKIKKIEKQDKLYVIICLLHNGYKNKIKLYFKTIFNTF